MRYNNRSISYGNKDLKSSKKIVGWRKNDADLLLGALEDGANASGEKLVETPD